MGPGVVKRGLKVTLLAILALLMLVLLTVTMVLGTATGSRWALGFVPGLTVENFQGHWAGSGARSFGLAARHQPG